MNSIAGPYGAIKLPTSNTSAYVNKDSAHSKNGNLAVGQRHTSGQYYQSDKSIALQVGTFNYKSVEIYFLKF